MAQPLECPTLEGLGRFVNVFFLAEQRGGRSSVRSPRPRTTLTRSHSATDSKSMRKVSLCLASLLGEGGGDLKLWTRGVVEDYKFGLDNLDKDAVILVVGPIGTMHDGAPMTSLA